MLALFKHHNAFSACSFTGTIFPNHSSNDIRIGISLLTQLRNYLGRPLLRNHRT